MNEQIVQMVPMLVLAGLGTGWLAETFLSRRGYGLTVDMGLGVGAALFGGGAFLAGSGAPTGMFVTFGIGLVLAITGVLAQRLWWPCESGVRELRTRLRLVELGRRASGEPGAASGLPGYGGGRTDRPMATGALARMATTGIYLLRGVPLELQRAARVRAVREGTTLRQVLLKGLGEYAAGSWTPQPDDKLPVALDPALHAAGP